MTETPGASDYVAGGVVAYSDRAKRELLDVARRAARAPRRRLAQVAEAMADGALARFDADLAVGVTGIAGPDGGTEEKPVGYVCICVKAADGAEIARDPVSAGKPRRDPGSFHARWRCT